MIRGWRLEAIAAVLAVALVFIATLAPAASGQLDVPDVDKPDVDEPEVDKPDVDVPDAPEVKAPEVPAAPRVPDPVPQPPRLPNAPRPDVPAPSASEPGDSGSSAPTSGGGATARRGSSAGGGSGGGSTSSQQRAWTFGVATSGLVRKPSGAPGAGSSRPAVLRYERRLRDTFARLRGCVSGLPGLERRVLTLRANVAAKRTRSRVVVARTLRISAGRVAALERRGLSRLRSASAVNGCGGGGGGGPLTIATVFLGVSDIGLVGAGTLAAISDPSSRASTSAPRSGVAGVQAEYPPALPTVTGARAASGLSAQILLPALLAMAVIAMVGFLLLRQRRDPLTAGGAQDSDAGVDMTQATATPVVPTERPAAAAPVPVAAEPEPEPALSAQPEPEPEPEPEPAFAAQPEPEPEPEPQPQLEAQPPPPAAASPPTPAEQPPPATPPAPPEGHGAPPEGHGHRREIGMAAGALTIGALRLLRRLRSRR